MRRCKNCGKALRLSPVAGGELYIGRDNSVLCDGALVRLHIPLSESEEIGKILKKYAV